MNLKSLKQLIYLFSALLISSGFAMEKEGNANSDKKRNFSEAFNANDKGENITGMLPDDIWRAILAEAYSCFLGDIKVYGKSAIPRGISKRFRAIINENVQRINNDVINEDLIKFANELKNLKSIWIKRTNNNEFLSAFRELKKAEEITLILYFFNSKKVEIV